MTRWLACALMALTLLGCGQLSARQRVSRALVYGGAAVGVVGGAIAVGCVRDTEPGLCSGGPGDGSFKIGLPVLTLGAALIAGGLLVRPPKNRPGGPPVIRHATPYVNDPYGPPPLNGY